MRPLSDQESYLKTKVTHTPEVIADIEQKLLEDGKWGINVSPAEGAFLRFLIELIQPQKVVEIGTQYGYSTMWMMDSQVEKIEMYTIEKDKAHFEMANGFFKSAMGEGSPSQQSHELNTEYQSKGRKLMSYCGDAVEVLESLSGQGPFDLVFIDANKGGYLSYMDWAEKNVKPGGYILADNTFLFGSVWLDDPGDKAPKNPWKKMKEFNERLADKNKFRSFMLPTPEGLSIAQRL